MISENKGFVFLCEIMSFVNNSQFEIEQKLNESATTVVYRAFDRVLHRTVLLKVLHKHLANDHELTERFTREARACAALRSEHIVQIYDLTEIDGAPAIVMEFVDGRSLKEAIAAGIDDPAALANTVGIHVLRALTVAHERGIIHRDIKPGNILLSDSGVVKVTDFGLAYVALSPTVTMEGMVLGTPAYMAPEQIRGDEVDQRTDLFALGVTLVETLTGERIFEGSTYSECMKKVLAFKVQELDRFDGRATPEFSAILKRLLHPSKTDRYSSSREALAAIGGHPPVSGNGSKDPSTPQNTKKKSVPYGIAAVAACIILIFGWMKLSPSGEEPKRSEQIPSVDTTMIGQQELSEQSSVNSAAVPPLQASTRDPETPLSIPAAPAAVDSGKLLFTSTPWAKVYVDNKLIGETPIAKPVLLAAGDHSVMFANPSFDPIVMTVTVDPGKERTVDGNFIVNAGYLMCAASPWAEVYVDEQYKDTTPLTKPLLLSAGKHTVRLKNSMFADVIKEITIVPKDTVFISHIFQ